MKQFGVAWVDLEQIRGKDVRHENDSKGGNHGCISRLDGL
jgi:hypothetical protein